MFAIKRKGVGIYEKLWMVLLLKYTAQRCINACNIGTSITNNKYDNSFRWTNRRSMYISIYSIQNSLFDIPMAMVQVFLRQLSLLLKCYGEQFYWTLEESWLNKVWYKLNLWNSSEFPRKPEIGLWFSGKINISTPITEIDSTILAIWRILLRMWGENNYYWAYMLETQVDNRTLLKSILFHLKFTMSWYLHV